MIFCQGSTCRNERTTTLHKLKKIYPNEQKQQQQQHQQKERIKLNGRHGHSIWNKCIFNIEL